MKSYYKYIFITMTIFLAVGILIAIVGSLLNIKNLMLIGGIVAFGSGFCIFFLMMDISDDSKKEKGEVTPKDQPKNSQSFVSGITDIQKDALRESENFQEEQDQFPFYKEMSLQIQIKRKEIEFKFSSLNEVVKTIFPESSLTNSKYTSQFNQAKAKALNILAKGEKVLNAFGPSINPSDERKEILGSYITSVDKIVKKVDGVIDELIKIDLQNENNSSAVLENQLDELQKVTNLYI